MEYSRSPVAEDNKEDRRRGFATSTGKWSENSRGIVEDIRHGVGLPNMLGQRH
jgi:hypothetical protein